MKFHEHGVNHHRGARWPRGQRAWNDLAAQIGDAWVADTEHERWRDGPAAAPHPEPVWACEEVPLSPEEEEEAYWRAADSAADHGRLF